MGALLQTDTGFKTRSQLLKTVLAY